MSIFGGKLAGIQYVGKAGISKACLDAVMRFIQYGDDIKSVRILTAPDKGHCLLFTINSVDLVAVKSGFSSGYNGEGPRTFSYILQLLLEGQKVDIEEYRVTNSLIRRLDNSALTVSDLKKISSSRPVHPWRIFDYIEDLHIQDHKDKTIWKAFRPVIPFAILDGRIVDLALSFWESPDDALLKGYIRLEDIIRKRTGFDGIGDIFSKVFLSEPPLLIWKNISENEAVGRGRLFSNIFKAYRHTRAHKEMDGRAKDLVSEFMLLNHLYLLEREAVEMQECISKTSN